MMFESFQKQTPPCRMMAVGTGVCLATATRTRTDHQQR